MAQLAGQPSPSPEVRSARMRTIVVLGARGVGKSASVIQYVDDHFVDVYSPTIESTFRKTIRWRGEQMVLSIRDTSGQDEHTVFHPRNCNGVHGFIIMYSVGSRESFRVCEFIHDKLLTNLMGRSDTVPVVLVGNKSDLEHQRQVSEAEGRALALSWNCPFVECSAKHNDNIREAFHRMLVTIHRHEDGDLEDPGCCGQMCSCVCPCDVQGASTKSQNGFMFSLKLCIVISMLFGLLLSGISFGNHTRLDSTGILLTYGIVVVGLCMFLSAFVGLWGARSYSVSLLRGFGVTSTVLLVVEIVLASLALEQPAHEHVVEMPSSVVAAIAVASCIVQAACGVLAFLAQRIAQQYDDHPSALLSGWGEMSKQSPLSSSVSQDQASVSGTSNMSGSYRDRRTHGSGFHRSVSASPDRRPALNMP